MFDKTGIGKLRIVFVNRVTKRKYFLDSQWKRFTFKRIRINSVNSKKLEWRITFVGGKTIKTNLGSTKASWFFEIIIVNKKRLQKVIQKMLKFLKKTQKCQNFVGFIIQ